MNPKYLTAIMTMLIKNAKMVLIACVVFFGLGSMSHAKWIKVTATGTITEMFNFSAAPFSIGDPFSYEVIVDDDLLLDEHPDPNYTRHSYLPNFLTAVAGSAKLTFGSYTISENNVETTSLFVHNNIVADPSDGIEISTGAAGAPLIDGLSPDGFSMKRHDPSGTALPDAEITVENLESGGFGSCDAVFLSVTTGGACLSRKCAYGNITNITALVLEPMAIPTLHIQANGTDGPVTIPTEGDMSLSVALDCGSISGLDADWWLGALTPSGWYYFDVAQGTWMPGTSFLIWQGPLFSFSNVELPGSISLPEGSSTFYFVIDTNMNGLLDADLYYDSVEVSITP